MCDNNSRLFAKDSTTIYAKTFLSLPSRPSLATWLTTRWSYVNNRPYVRSYNEFTMFMFYGFWLVTYCVYYWYMVTLLSHDKFQLSKCLYLRSLSFMNKREKCDCYCKIITINNSICKWYLLFIYLFVIYGYIFSYSY